MGAGSQRRDPPRAVRGMSSAAPSGWERGEAPTVPGPTSPRYPPAAPGAWPGNSHWPRAAPLTCVSSQVRLEVRRFPVNFLAARVVALVLSLRGLEVGATSTPPAPLSEAGLAAPRGPRLSLRLQPRLGLGLGLAPRRAEGRGRRATGAGGGGLGGGWWRGRQAAGGPRLPGRGALSALRGGGRRRLLVKVRQDPRHYEERGAVLAVAALFDAGQRGGDSGRTLGSRLRPLPRPVHDRAARHGHEALGGEVVHIGGGCHAAGSGRRAGGTAGRCESSAAHPHPRPPESWRGAGARRALSAGWAGRAAASAVTRAAPRLRGARLAGHRRVSAWGARASGGSPRGVRGGLS